MWRFASSSISRFPHCCISEITTVSCARRFRRALYLAPQRKNECNAPRPRSSNGGRGGRSGGGFSRPKGKAQPPTLARAAGGANGARGAARAGKDATTRHDRTTVLPTATAHDPPPRGRRETTPTTVAGGKPQPPRRARSNRAPTRAPSDEGGGARGRIRRDCDLRAYRNVPTLRRRDTRRRRGATPSPEEARPGLQCCTGALTPPSLDAGSRGGRGAP